MQDLIEVTPVTVDLLVDSATAWIKARRKRSESSVTGVVPPTASVNESVEEKLARLEIRDIGWKLHADGGLELMHRTFDAAHDSHGSAVAERINIAWIGSHSWVS